MPKQPVAPMTARTPSTLVKTLRHALRPFVRLMLSHGIHYPYFAELLKGLFVEITEKDFRLDGKPPTDSRVSLVSGVHRKDVSRLRSKLRSPDEEVPIVVSLGAELVARWLGTPRYLDDSGKPRPLARFAREGGELSFEALVASVSSDIRSRVVLDEWLRLGIARLDDERRVCLNTDAFVPTKGLDEKIYYFGHNIHDHTAAAVHNLLEESQSGSGKFTPFMERSVYCDELSPTSLQSLSGQCEALGMQALLEANKSTLEAYTKDQADTAAQPRYRMTFGVYFYAEQMLPEDSTDDGGPS